jgi:hypothetical protein
MVSVYERGRPGIAPRVAVRSIGTMLATRGGPLATGMTTHEIAEKGRAAVAAELQRRGASEIELRGGDVARRRTVAIRVRDQDTG